MSSPLVKQREKFCIGNKINFESQQLIFEVDLLIFFGSPISIGY